MNKSRLIIGAIPLFSVIFLASCNTSKMAKITSFSEEKPDVYSYTTLGDNPTISKLDAFCQKIPMYFINNDSVPYYSITTGLADMNAMNTQAPTIYSGYTAETKDYKSTITNKANESTCVIDYRKQTFEFSNYSAFRNNDKDQVTPLDIGFTQGRNYFTKIEKVKYVEPKQSLVIDLSKYNISLFFKDDEGYVPMEVFHNIINPFHLYQMVYLNKNIYINAENNTNAKNQLTINNALNVSYSEDRMKYCYNLNALTLDYCFGMRSRASRALIGHNINYNIDAYTNLNKYGKENFLSTSSNVANDALMSAIDNEYDDGGHTALQNVGFLNNKVPSINAGMEFNEFLKVNSSLSKARTEKGLDPSTVIKAPVIGDFTILDKTSSSGEKDTAFLTMDTFAQTTTTTTEYYQHTVGLVKHAHNLLKNDAGKKVKNLVIDLSLNGGGCIYSQLFMSSWLTNGTSKLKTCSFLTGDYSEVSYQADVDGDGDFDDDDKISSTGVENIYVITSANTYSAANMLASDLNDYCTNVKFIGSHSGGGACAVNTGLLTGYGSRYQASSNCVTCFKNADENNFITNDSGVTPAEQKFAFSPISQAANYYDRDALFDLIHA